jgi:hypothetical protein
MASSDWPDRESSRNAARRVRRFSSVRDLLMESSLHQNVFHYQRDQVPETLLLAIEEHCDRRVAETFERVGANLFRTLEKPARVQ